MKQRDFKVIHKANLISSKCTALLKHTTSQSMCGIAVYSGRRINGSSAFAVSLTTTTVPIEEVFEFLIGADE